MRSRFTQSFKIQAVEKALNRNDGTSMKELAESLGIGYSTLETWIRKSRNQEFETDRETGLMDTPSKTKEKRPQDWTQEDKLNMLMTCASLSQAEISNLCREQGLYPHHVNQWKVDFLKSNTLGGKANSQGEIKTLRLQNKALKKELNRKDRALAETAALLVLQKKVNEIWGSDEDNSQ